LILAGYFFLSLPHQAEKITWGVNFSQKHAFHLGLDWQETYLAILDDLKVKNIKLLTHWDQLEPQKDNYFFDDLQWQIAEAEKREAKIILVVGMKTGRWPECHIPDWAQNLSKDEQQKEILEVVEKIVLKYRGQISVRMWQVENEPFFPFGLCPWQDEIFVKKEIELIKELDFQKRPVVISDSGELSFWFRAARLGDIVGTTMYRKVWAKELGMYLFFPLPPAFYWQKAKLIEKFFDKKVIVVELQAEPWGPKLLYDSPLEEQKKTMNLRQFRQNIEFAKRTGFDEFYLWGVEWWYWLKENFPQDQDAAIWQEAKARIGRD
jgi:hypothetical protein